MGISVRKFLILVLTSIAAIGAHAGEVTTADTEPQAGLAQSSYTEALVTIAPVPMPAMVIELARYLPQSTSFRQAKRVKAAKVARAKSMLSRSARKQIALARASVKPDGRARLSASENEDAGSAIDGLDLHQFFRQPKVAKASDQADDDDEAVIGLSDHVKIRLLMARTKAVEAYILSQVGKASGRADEELSDTAKIRLYIARARAVKVHSEKYGVA